MSVKIQPVIVVYNIRCEESLSVRDLLEYGSKPLIVDNSTKEFGNRDFCLRKGLQYISMGGNAGLSKAYNAALDHIGKDADFVLWLDDDTALTDDYINKLTSIVSGDTEHKLFLPLVKSGSNYLSPNIVRGLRTGRISDVKEMRGKELSAINSGMLVSTDIYDSYRYDEKLFLDCIDHDFMAYCRKNSIPFTVTEDIVLFQNFSGDEKGELKGKLGRYAIFSKDFRYYGKKNGFSRAAVEAFLIKRKTSIWLNWMLKGRR